MSRPIFSAKPFVIALAGAALIGAASGAFADRLLPAADMPEAKLTLVSNAGARAFDHIRAARQQIEVRHAFEARQELAQARKLLAEARTAVPASRVQDRIATLLRRIEDPSVKLKYTDVDPIYAEIEAAGGGDAYGATWRYVERARYQLWNQDRNGATRELLAASARVPYGRIDGPLGASYERVNQAMILLYDLDLTGADALLAAAEDNAHAVVQIASGAELPMEDLSAPDVAAPPAAPTFESAPELAPEIAPEIAPEALTPAPMESEIPPGAEFQESPSPEPAAVEETVEDAVQWTTPALPDVSAPELTTPEIPATATEATAEAAEEAAEARAEAIEDAAEAQTEAVEEAAEAFEDAAEAQAEAVEEAAEAFEDAAKAQAEAIEDAAEAQAEAAEAAAEGAAEETTPDVAAPPAP